MKLPIVLLSLAAFASAASMRVTDALLPRIASDFGVGLARASAVVTGFTVASGFMQVLFGPLGDRLGKLRVVSHACGAAAIASAGCLFAPGFDGLVVARIFTGAFCACVIPLSMAWIGDVVPYEERQPVIARFLIGQICGLAAGTAVGGFAAEHAEWRWPFGLLAAWFALTFAAVARVARSDPAPRIDVPARLSRDAASIFASSWSRIVVGSVFVEGLLVFGALAFIPTHLHYERGIDLSMAGLSLVAYAFGGVAFAIFAGPIVRRLGEVRLAIGGSVLLMAGCVLIALSKAPMLAATGCLVAGVGFYAFHNTLQTNATQMAPERRGAAMALFASFFFLGQSVGVAIAGVLAEHVGTTAVILGAGIAVIPVGINFGRLRRSRAEKATGD